ncbi:pyrimidine/purine nucleoside phosphorylase [Shewanella yunxiaonensis]|uniref:Pyrimidine/purine nucleoside phosphorylase n=1 Tax=Shewanella yunxiaonensis TaxID=2829809 RepID=A0ABX7YUC1_9GAMM|nr:MULTISPECIES: pyrimidine/purine nucleoside phosphorylase [Shewanella]MDF0533067.1 pyrimidine/purine nucleoside phosphorylase [Shewanella sp. A32]QUN06375.1 pyrimidine/purine nucleoside phosphorylase [Shewanella yunxiaonensis]
MSEFQQVTVAKKANIYFEGKVTSRKLTFADGTVKTLGIMLPGDYQFGTDAPELMEIQVGELDVLLPGSDQWLHVSGGESFSVPGNASFSLKVQTVTDYCCSYLK